ncbi:hypothetical protein [Sphingobacterium bambusae]|uniref:Bacteriocin n=1 Tax=Sphingobacterium bambusae TaxID=662858 RepID=A0ABW6BAW9_9SPHI|nr:hypothetical protein [Sphingobacterium bambusae]WPL49149.1 hypothetical protein SCB77_01550 [Sphingobacterium bambusae]
MKKISFKDLGSREVEKLSLEQLKTVLGGFSGSGSDNPKIDACSGKKKGDSCSWVHGGVTYTGRCDEVPGPLHCTS